MTMKLTQKQTRHLKALAHGLKPVVRVGQHGVSKAVIAELELALERHELLKVKVSAGDRELRATMISELCDQTSAICIQRIGNMAVLFRRNTTAPTMALPDE